MPKVTIQEGISAATGSAPSNSSTGGSTRSRRNSASTDEVDASTIPLPPSPQGSLFRRAYNTITAHPIASSIVVGGIAALAAYKYGYDWSDCASSIPASIAETALESLGDGLSGWASGAESATDKLSDLEGSVDEGTDSVRGFTSAASTIGGFLPKMARSGYQTGYSLGSKVGRGQNEASHIADDAVDAVESTLGTAGGV